MLDLPDPGAQPPMRHFEPLRGARAATGAVVMKTTDVVGPTCFAHAALLAVVSRRQTTRRR